MTRLDAIKKQLVHRQYELGRDETGAPQSIAIATLYRTDVEALVRVAEAAQSYIDYLRAGEPVTYGGQLRRERISSALAELEKEQP